MCTRCGLISGDGSVIAECDPGVETDSPVRVVFGCLIWGVDGKCDRGCGGMLQVSVGQDLGSVSG